MRSLCPFVEDNLRFFYAFNLVVGASDCILEHSLSAGYRIDRNQLGIIIVVQEVRKTVAKGLRE